MLQRMLILVGTNVIVVISRSPGSSKLE